MYLGNEEAGHITAPPLGPPSHTQLLVLPWRTCPNLQGQNSISLGSPTMTVIRAPRAQPALMTFDNNAARFPQTKVKNAASCNLHHQRF